MKPVSKNLVLPALFLSLGLVLPFLTGQIPQIGQMLLPMHIPVLLCGLICGSGGPPLALCCRCCARFCLARLPSFPKPPAWLLS